MYQWTNGACCLLVPSDIVGRLSALRLPSAKPLPISGCPPSPSVLSLPVAQADPTYRQEQTNGQTNGQTSSPFAFAPLVTSPLSLSPSLFLARYIPHWECCSNKAGREGRPADGLASFQPPSLTFTALWMDGMAAVTEGRRELSLYAAGGWVSRHLAA